MLTEAGCFTCPVITRTLRQRKLSGERVSTPEKSDYEMSDCINSEVDHEAGAQSPTERSDAAPRAPSRSEWAMLDRLEQQVMELVELCAILGRENRALRTQQQNWTTERAKLIEKNELAKSRVESMITRLKALEQD